MTARTDLGRRGEDAAASYLASTGWRILDRNVRCREAEVDIVAARGVVLALVEVKTRRTRRFGTPAEAVTARKRARIRGMASRILASRPGYPEVRFDVIEVFFECGRFRISHIEGAF